MSDIKIPDHLIMCKKAVPNYILVELIEHKDTKNNIAVGIFVGFLEMGGKKFYHIINSDDSCISCCTESFDILSIKTCYGKINEELCIFTEDPVDQLLAVNILEDLFSKCEIERGACGDRIKESSITEVPENFASIISQDFSNDPVDDAIKGFVSDSNPDIIHKSVSTTATTPTKTTNYATTTTYYEKKPCILKRTSTERTTIELTTMLDKVKAIFEGTLEIEFPDLDKKV